ncbi:MAG: hypothetical protein LBF26_02695 [Puniceicoccales bacterium]|jgi:hypothetical protein|nr:hypothetical protein [Puniceicoccales bacterium]
MKIYEGQSAVYNQSAGQVTPPLSTRGGTGNLGRHRVVAVTVSNHPVSPLRTLPRIVTWESEALAERVTTSFSKGSVDPRVRSLRDSF